MGLASGADVKIGDYEFVIDKSAETHYARSWEPILDRNPSVVGEIGKRHLKGDRLLWSMTDWSGGEGNRLWYQDDPTVYETSDSLNGRIRGQLTGRPDRDVDSVTYADQRDRPTLQVADGALWLGGSQTLAYNTDGSSTWTAKTSGISSPSIITAMAGDHEYLYYTAWESTASGTRIVRRVDQASAAADVVSSGTGLAVYAGLTIMAGRLYAWTGRRLHELDIFQSVPLASKHRRKVYDTGVDPATANVFGTKWWADAISTENSVVFFYSTAQLSNVYEYKGGVGRPLWRGPYGFTVKSAAYQNGIIFLAGHWGGSGNTGWGGMYAIPLDTRRAVFVGWFRKFDNANLQMQEMCGSYGPNILITAARTGRVFNYDADLDAISMVEDFEGTDGMSFTNNDHRVGHMATFGNKRVLAVYRPGAGAAGTTIQLVRFATDEPSDRATSPSGGLSETLEMGEWDYDLPFDVKTLHGFHVTFKPLTANQRITISYAWDGDSYTDMTAITSATSGSASGRVYQAITTPPNGYRLKVKITLDTNATASVTQPILYGLTAEAEAISYQQVWDLALRIKHERQKNARPSNRADIAEVIRDDFDTLMTNKAAVTFLDGFRYSSQPNKTKSHTVTIDRVQDVIGDSPAEGTIFVRLKEVPS